LSIQFLPANSFCDSANGLINTIITNGTGSLQYTWNTGQTTNSIHQLEPKDYWLKVTDSLGCEAMDTVTIKDDGVPHLKVVQYIPPVCKGDKTGQLTLYGISGVAPYKYSFDGITFSATAQLSNFSAGTYTIYIRDANSCISDTVITFPEGNEIVITNTLPDSVICYHDTTAAFSVNAALGVPPYLWSINNSPFSNNTQFTKLAQGIYTIQVVDSKNCKSSKNVTVYGPYLPLNVTLKTSDIACYEELTGKLEAEISGGWQPLTFKWSHLNSLFLFLDNQKEGIYSITVTDKKGCVIVASDTIQKKYCCNCYLPNSFTPNGDGLNDELDLQTYFKTCENYTMYILNRWGNVIYEYDDPAGGWNGKTSGGDIVSEGTYFYRIDAKFEGAEPIVKHGFVEVKH
jgi:gliding motility-associated-like protein